MNTQQETQKNPEKTDFEHKFPALKHRPVPASAPAQAKSLAPVRAAFQKNPDVNLPAEAAGVITAGLPDPKRFRMTTETHAGPQGEITSLLNKKRVSEGVVFVTPQHDRYIDMGVLPDVAGARWVHTLHNRLDVESANLAAARLSTAAGPNGPWAMLELEVDDHVELAARVKEAFAKTGPDHSTVGNDYTDSILQSGVKEALLLVPMRVKFDDGSPDEHYLVTADGNSRLVSMWKGRTGGSVDQAASACVEAVIGTPSGPSWRSVSQRQARERLTNLSVLINKGLQDDTLTESTIRAGHTFTAPTVVVVGGQTDDGSPLTDLVAAREDLIATIHTEATPWSAAAQAEQGMGRVLRRAAAKDILTSDELRVLEGRCTVQEMHDMLGVPAHRLWAAAYALQAVLNPWYNGMGELFREEFNTRNITRLALGKQIASTALSAYRSASNLGPAVNAYADGGPITQYMWDYRWYLAKGDNPVDVLNGLLQTALAGTGDDKLSAIAQLSVLGGTAAMLDGLVSRDRGSKETEDGKRTPGKVPFRTRPYRIIEALTLTEGGIRTLHSMAVGHVATKSAKKFHSSTDPEGQFADGDAVIDDAGAHTNLELEWDVVETADPQRAATAIAAAGAKKDHPTTKSEPERLRENLHAAATSIAKSVSKLSILAAGPSGADVFGSYDAVRTIMDQLMQARDELQASGPKAPVIIGDDSDLDFDEADE